MTRKRKPRRIVKSYFNKIAALPVRPIFALLLKVPESWIRVLSEIIAWGFANFAFPLKRMAIKNLRIAYKNTLSDDKIKIIAKESMKNIVRMMSELTIIIRPSYTTKDTPIEGEHHLKEALKGDKGILILGSHVGNFLLLILSLAQKGYPLHYILKESKDENFRDFVRELNKNLGLKPIPVKPRSEATKRSLRALRDREMLWLALDQDTKFGDIGVEFFGVKVGTSRGPAILAQRTESTVLPIYAKREGWLKHTLIVKEPVKLVNSGDKDMDIYKNLKRMNGVLEEEITENPEEWWWVHRRWKRAYRYSDEETKEMS
ncbi:MAG: lysophospholipid acyltransferase family protein [Deltaproteobacteria bacterium]|uniref:Lysophospholipid acyltransferase family protein n=1 Tax=Candidatus Zymogenus saltonus TaxID=2844893 RepID=A0A9D8PNB6_9DELT|nr:lysophospholipid acyltransferase family protein [Candidatus Zymogenus saltonus]